ncbi:hypothetical protein M3J09_008665 [Ascochyta lentis]
MKAFGFLIAAAALFSGTVSQLLPVAKQPAPNSSLGNGWRYKGCYSDARYDLPVSHALGGAFRMQNPNGGVSCTAYCRGLSYNFAGTNDDQCCMFMEL